MNTPASVSWTMLSAPRRSRIASGLPILREAFEDARELSADTWEFALTIRALLSAGLNEADLRWLVALGLVEKAMERICRHKGDRLFLPAPRLAMSETSCFVLTKTGLKFLESRPADELACGNAGGQGEPRVESPHWDVGRRELMWLGELVKRFRTPAQCQELILSAFEEEGWPPRIDDPLWGGTGRHSRERLHDAVRCLNRNQLHRRIRFTRDGTGQGVRWET